MKQFTLQDWAFRWHDSPEWHSRVHESFCQYVNETPYLNDHRSWVERTVWGLGERSFQWAWKLIVDEMPNSFSFLEIGVHRGQITSLIGLLACEQNKTSSTVVGLSEYSGKAMGLSGNFLLDAETIWCKFVTEQYRIPQRPRFVPITGNSLDPATVQKAKDVSSVYDIVYIDGAHDYESAKQDIANYSPLVRVGGYLVMDDSGNRFRMPWGYFQGIDSCSQAVDEVFPPFAANPNWKFLFNVMHLRIFQKVQGENRS